MKKTTVWSKHSENDLYWPRNTLYSTDTRQRRGINLDRLGLKTMTHTHCPKDAALSSALLKHGLSQSCLNSAPLQEPQQLDCCPPSADTQQQRRERTVSLGSRASGWVQDRWSITWRRRRLQQPAALLFPQPLPAACLCLCQTRMTCRHRYLPVTVNSPAIKTLRHLSDLIPLADGPLFCSQFLYSDS